VLLNSQQLRDLKTIPGTRLLEDPLGLQGAYIMDYREPWRHWTVQWLLAPVPGRKLGGIRAKVMDHKGFVSFINQRDLEVTLGHGKAGEWCQWLGEEYKSPDDLNWYGLCCDDEDLRDDLFERECWLRQQPHLKEQPYLPSGLGVTRRIHLDEGRDVEQLDTLLWDMDPVTRTCPDPRLETISKRWSKVERNPVVWGRL
jgi:hypothetical protein